MPHVSIDLISWIKISMCAQRPMAKLLVPEFLYELLEDDL